MGGLDKAMVGKGCGSSSSSSSSSMGGCGGGGGGGRLTPTPTPALRTPMPTLTPTSMPTPTPTTCKRDTGADCSLFGCFQHTRGSTECHPVSKTCVCSVPSDCVWNVSMPFAKEWKICRPDAASADHTVLGWSILLVRDIFESYFGFLR